MARLVQTSLEANGGICRSLLQVRHSLATEPEESAAMKAARLHAYHEALKLESVDEPKADGPFDVIVRIGAAGLCRTDLHIQEGQWAEKSQVALPYTPGHENAGWVHEIGSGVTNVEVGDTVIVHPFISCGLCLPCRARRRHALPERLLPRDQPRRRLRRPAQDLRALGGQARPGLQPKDIAALADAGLTAIHAVKKAIPVLSAGTRAVVIGAGGLGPHRHPVPEGDDPGRDHRRRPLREGAGAGRRDGRRPDRARSTVRRTSTPSRR